MDISVRNVLGACAAVVVLAIVFLVLAKGPETAAVFGAVGSQSLLSKLAWAVVVLVPLGVVLYAVWLGETLAQQRRAARLLELRLDGVRDGTKALAKSQTEAETALHHLARTDPEDAIGAAQQRLTEAERFALVQEGRNAISDLDSRVDEIRVRQQALQQRLAPVLEKRRSIEQLFMELDGRQNDIARMLAEVGGGDDAAALDNGLKKMMEFVALSHERCDEIEGAAKTIAGLKEDYAGLRDRLAPLAAPENGIASRVKELSSGRDILAAEIDTVVQTPQGPLPERVKAFADDKKTLELRLAEISEQFAKLATLREDFTGLFAGFDRALDKLATDGSGAGASDIDMRVEELGTFIKATQTQVDDIEERLAGLRALKGKLDVLQARLVPLESTDGGVVSLLGDIKDIRDKLTAKIKRMEASDEGGLAERVSALTETRRELEERVATLSDQVLKLATIRKDIAGLFEKLSSAASAN